MTAAALYFALSAALLIGALLTLAGGVALAEEAPLAASFGDPELRPFALAVGVFGLLVFIAAASAIVGVVGSPA